MPPSKVCPQCKAIVPIRQKVCKSCEHVFQTKRRAEHELWDKRMPKSRKRASETSEQTLHRREQNREHMASMRASETSKQTLHRQEQDKKHKASMRATKKMGDVSVQQAIMSFHCDIKNGPDFVCTCCHRLMYSKSVVPCNLVKYTKCSNDLLECVFSADLRHVSDTGNEWLCKTCDRALKRGVMPLQAKANGLKLSQIPPNCLI